jgi:hypothetical protein
MLPSTRYHPDCKNAGDKAWRRCNCPKWIWGSVNGNFIGRSARTHNWDEAEELRLRLQKEVTQAALPALQAAEPSPPPTALAPATASRPGTSGWRGATSRPKRPRITIKKAVESYLADAVILAHTSDLRAALDPADLKRE